MKWHVVAQAIVAGLVLYAMRNTQVAVQFGFRAEPDGEKGQTSQNVGFAMQTVNDEDDDD